MQLFWYSNEDCTKKKKKKIQLKLWLFQVAKCYGSQFEKKNVPERFF